MSRLFCLINACLLAGLPLLAGCSAKHHRLDAGKVAYNIIDNAQQEVLGHSEPFTIDRPSDTLRQRLLEQQGLPHSGPEALGVEYLTPPKHWPKDDYPHPVNELDLPAEPMAPWETGQPLRLSLLEALYVAARNSREYQTQKEDVFLFALDLDLAYQEFRHTFSGLLEGLVSSDLSGPDHIAGTQGTALLGVTRRLYNGITLSTRIGLDVAKLLTMDRSSSFGVFGDATISIPLLRGAGRHIVTEPLTQAERNVIYAIHRFERYKRTFTVQVISSYLRVLQQADQVENAEQSYRRLIANTRRARRLADAGQLPEIQVDQSIQNELRARDRWISVLQSYARAKDDFNILLGLPTDAQVELDNVELLELLESPMAEQAIAEAQAAMARPGDSNDEPESLMAPTDASPLTADSPIELEPPVLQGEGEMELDADEAIRIALDNRLDLRTAVGRVFDAQRRVVVAADALRADLTLLGAASAGERRSVAGARLDDANLRFEQGRYSALLSLDLPLERTAERNRYRESYIVLEEAIRNVQDLEDRIKLDIRNNLRSLLQSRQSVAIQARSVVVAMRRVASTDLFLQAGRAQIRDVLEAQDALVTAQDAFTSALVNYRIAELQMQRDMETLEVAYDDGLQPQDPGQELNNE